MAEELPQSGTEGQPQPDIEARRAQRLKEILDIEKNPPLLLVIDMQRDYMGRDGKAATSWGADISSMEAIVPKINAVVDAFHTLGRPVVRTQMFEDLKYRGVAQQDRAIFFEGAIDDKTEQEEVACISGTPGADLILPPDEGDVVITKTTPSAATPELRDFIEKNGIKTVMVTGVKTQRCVFRTVGDLYDGDLGVHVVPLEDCIGSDDERLKGIQGHTAFLEEMRQFYGPVISSERLLQEWEPRINARKAPPSSPEIAPAE